MDWKKFFKPTKGRIILAVIISVVHILFFAKAYYFSTVLWFRSVLSYLIVYGTMLVILSTLYYPLSCFIVYLKKDHKKINKKDFFVVLIIVLIVNPFTIAFLINPDSFSKEPEQPKKENPLEVLLQYSCGVRIINFSEEKNNPSLNAGLKINDTIIGMDGKRFFLQSEFIKLLDQKKSFEKTKLKVGRKGEYEITTIEHPDIPGKGYLGIYFVQNVCREKELNELYRDN